MMGQRVAWRISWRSLRLGGELIGKFTAKSRRTPRKRQAKQFGCGYAAPGLSKSNQIAPRRRNEKACLQYSGPVVLCRSGGSRPRSAHHCQGFFPWLEDRGGGRSESDLQSHAFQ